MIFPILNFNIASVTYLEALIFWVKIGWRFTWCYSIQLQWLLAELLPLSEPHLLRPVRRKTVNYFLRHHPALPAIGDLRQLEIWLTPLRHYLAHRKHIHLRKDFCRNQVEFSYSLVHLVLVMRFWLLFFDIFIVSDLNVLGQLCLWRLSLCLLDCAPPNAAWW